jgi:RNA polymerase sigma-70 factor (ECF subfamily)
MTLLEACKAGDEAAWRRLFQERSAQIYRWAVLLGLGSAEAEDAAQEVLAIAARRIDTCRADEAMGSWLYQITRRVVSNARRNGWWKRAFLGSDGDIEPAFEHETHEDAGRELAVRTCLEKLPRAQSEVLVLMEIEGYTREEVADMLGIPTGTVASRARLAKKAFQTHWEANQAPLEAMGLSWGKQR